MFHKLLNILVAPGDVFEEIVAAPPRPANWVVPTLLVCLGGIILQQLTVPAEHSMATLERLAREGALSAAQAAELSVGGPLVSLPAALAVAFAGTFWAALVLWLIGRVLLKTQFSFLKTLEIVGLSAGVMVLGLLITLLLVAATADSSARPALSLLTHASNSRTYAVLDVLNGFHIWTACVLAVGYSKLARVAFKEAAFWVFGYWVVARLALAVLA